MIGRRVPGPEGDGGASGGRLWVSVQQVWRSYGCLETSQSRPGTCSDLFYLARKLVRVPFAPFSTGKLNAENETVGKEREREKNIFFLVCDF